MKVVHVLAELNHSGAERMLECSFDRWKEAGVDPVVFGMADGVHGFAPALVNAGYEVRILPPVRSVRGLAALRTELSRTRPHIVHIHPESCYDAVALVAASTPGVRGLVRTVHSNFRFSGFLGFRRTARIALARRLGVVWIACSEEVAETERSFSRITPTSVIENWIDVDRISREATAEAGAQIRRKLGIPPQATVLAMVGNCGGAKNHEFIPKVLRSVDDPVHVLHIGHSRCQTAAEAVAWEDLPKHHVAHHLGERSDVPALLAASDLLLHPSQYEGFPLTVAEALCAKVPIIASDVGGLRWLGAMNSARLLPLDEGLWAAGITASIRDGHDPTVLRDCSAFAKGRFRADRGVAEYISAYRSALNASPFLLRPANQAPNIPAN